MQLLRQKSVVNSLNLDGLQVRANKYQSTVEYLKEIPNLGDYYYKKICNENYVYYFDVLLQSRTYTIRRTVKEFQNLEKQLSDMWYLFREKEIKKEDTVHNPQKVLENLTRYLNQALEQFPIPEKILDFLEISYVKIGHSQKFKEAFFMKQAGGRFSDSRCKRCGTFWAKWDKRYFIITSEGVMYSKGSKAENCTIREVLTFDNTFKIQYGDEKNSKSIIIQCSTRRLVLRALNYRIYFDFLYCLLKALKECIYNQIHPFDSFSPTRNGNCKWYIDGQNYYKELYEELQLAKESIYITDWWLSPEFYLRRPVGRDNKETRLDLLLKRKGDEGVQILIILYNEPRIALNNDSDYTKQHLESLSQNIKVLKHPSQKIPFLFSHHEKMVIIDSITGFMGGLDLCFGRMDTQQHHLFDSDDVEYQFWPGIDFSNSRVKDFYDVKNQYENCLLPDKRECPRMPWHDVAMQLGGEIVIDMSRHFVQYWNFVTLNLEFKQRDDQLLHQFTSPLSSSNLKLESYDGYFQLEEQNPSPIKSLSKSEKENQIINLFQNQDSNQSENQNQYSNLQNHGSNQNISQQGKQRESFKEVEPIQAKIRARSQQFELEMNHQKLNSQARSNSLNDCKFLANKQIKKLIQKIKETTKQDQDKEEYFYVRQKKITHYNRNDLDLEQEDEKQKVPHIYRNTMVQFRTDGHCEIQMLRSASNWSIGLNAQNTEQSIQIAYLNIISSAEHHIYIENQFFISDSAGSTVRNQISTAIINRIKQAHINKQKFKVTIFLPLLPGFEGEINDGKSAVLKVQLYWEYQTICRGGTSLMEQLQEFIDDPSEYIEFYSLRSHGVSKSGKPCTEILYIHSKLIIVDDTFVIIGSANINDRSLMGDRDSEIAMIINDKIMIEGKMDGQTIRVNKFAHTLRTSLYMEHFGITYSQAQDPILNQWLCRGIAKKNTNLFRTIFSCYPDDNIETIDQWKDVFILFQILFQKFQTKTNLDKYDANEFQGHAVLFPFKFLEKENLKIKIYQKEFLCPEINFT